MCADFRCAGIYHYDNGAAQHGPLKNAGRACREVVRQARAAEGLHASQRENNQQRDCDAHGCHKGDGFV